MTTESTRMIALTRKEATMLLDGLEASTQYLTARELDTKQVLVDKLSEILPEDPDDAAT